MLTVVQLIFNTESMGNFTMLYAVCGEWAASLPLFMHGSQKCDWPVVTSGQGGLQIENSLQNFGFRLIWGWRVWFWGQKMDMTTPNALN